MSNIPLEYFERALRWLAAQPEVDRNRIVTFGVSRGGEASLLIASTFPRLVHGAVGYVPSAITNGAVSDSSMPAWTYRGRPLHGDWIPVERIDGPVFVVGGGADKLWTSGDSVRRIERRMLDHDRRDVTALVYAKAGHEIGQAFPRLFIVSAAGYGFATTRDGTLDLGGSPRADEAALEDSWPKLLAFLSRIDS